VDRADALSVLGLAEGTSPTAVRDRYLELLRRHHPDLAGAASTATAATITEAYRVVRTTLPAPPDAVEPAVTVMADGDTLVVGLPADEAFLALLDVAASIGDVTYVDPEGGLIETLVTFTTGSAASLVMSLQGRAATGTTDAFCTLARRGRGDVPDVVPVVAERATKL
jgi:hypothetical protein